MITTPRTGRRQQGFALVAVLMISVVLVLLALGAAVTGSIDRSISGNQLRGNAAYYAAQAGMAQLKTTLFRNLVDYYAAQGGWCAPPVEGGIDFGSFKLLPGEPSSLIAFGTGGGGYRLEFDFVGSKMILTSVGEVGTGRATIRVVASAGGGPSTAWDNAIFAEGQSPNAQAINGNVSVYGSVHIVNGQMALDDAAYTTTGDAGVFDTYVGAGTGDSYIMDKLSTVTPTTDLSGNPIDLCARVKIASGSIYLQSGSSIIGATSPGSPVYTINLGHGNVYRGKPGTGSVTQITDWHNSGGLVTLKYPVTAGINSGYGAYSAITFPELDSTWPNDTGYTATIDTCGWLYGPNAAGTIVAEVPPPDPTQQKTCGSGSNTLTWVPDTTHLAGGHLVINGTVTISDANLEVHETTVTLADGTTASEGVYYSGTGTLRVGATSTDTTAGITMTGSLKPVDVAGFPGTYDANGNYVSGDVLALVTPGDMTVDLTASDQVTAFLGYAGNTFYASKQVILVGAIVAGQFDLGTNVPKIAYAKGIGDAAEHLGLPGTFAASGTTPPNKGVLSDISVERTELPAWAVP